MLLGIGSSDAPSRECTERSVFDGSAIPPTAVIANPE